MPIAPLVFRNARIFDGHSADCPEGMWVIAADGVIQEISSRSLKAPRGARTIDVGGRTLMPGLIDAHVHAYASDVNVHKIETAGPTYRAAHGVRMLGFALDCGFTTVRDIGGGDYSLAKAIADGLIRAPRFLYSGKVLSMTGGHGDMRPIDETPQYHSMCSCGIFNSFAKVADGVTEVVRATREELRQGAHCIKIMGSGGVASPTDPLWMNQYREDEIRAIVLECSERRTYASAHCHPASAARRCGEFGVRFIALGTLLDEEPAIPYTLDMIADDIKGLLDHVGAKQVHWIGLSMGGVFGLATALRHPGTFASMVLADTSSRLSPEGIQAFRDRVSAVRAGGMEAMVQPTLKRWFKDSFREKQPALMARVADWIRTTPAEGYIGTSAAIPTIDVTERLGEITVPCLALVGADDIAMPPAFSKVLAERLPDCRMVEIPDAGHLSNLEQPEHFNQALEKFHDRIL